MTGAESGGDSASGFALIEMVFSFGVVLALAIWQWWQVRDAKSGSAKPSDSAFENEKKPDG